MRSTTTRLRALVLPVMLLGVASAGCASGGLTEDDVYVELRGPGAELALATRDGHLRGALGDARGFDTDADFSDAFDDGASSTVSLWADGGAGEGAWATMASITARGEARRKLFTPGQSLRFSAGHDESELSAYACSGKGARAADLAFESDAVEIEIEVEESDRPGMVAIAWGSEYFTDEGLEHVAGRVLVAVPSAEVAR